MPVPTTFPTSQPRFRITGLIDQLGMPHHFPTQGELLNFCYHMGPGEAALMLIVGVLLVLFGINIYKFIVMINAALFGAGIGAFFGDKAGNGGVGAAVGGFIAAIVSWPFMKHAVAIMGFAVGAIAGAGLWRAFALNPEMFWAGAMVGGITVGMLSFLAFRGCIMIVTSLQGSLMVVTGVLGLLLKYHDLAPKLGRGLSARQWVLPVAIFVPALCGWIFQHMPGPGGGGGGAKPTAKK
jgi:hypothetical protein